MLPPMPVARVVLALVLACLPLAAQALTLRYASQDDPQTLDPHAANLLSSSRVTANLYETLVWRDKAWKIVPWLATSWSQPDAKTWRFRLREGVKFHDGATLTADDVVFSVERALTPLSQMRVSLQGVEKAVKVDALTVDLVMREPNPALLAAPHAVPHHEQGVGREARRGRCRRTTRPRRTPSRRATPTARARSW